jgi:isopentenyl diphosphate isomerase/L-lactate dehydrogenase-like FMN-dependent dehydrogenase
MKFKDLLELAPLFENAKNKERCKKTHCKDLMKAVETERKENGKYIQNYFTKSKAHKEFIKKQNEYKKITDIKEQNRLNKLNLKEYHKTAEYKEFNKRTDSFLNSKTKKQLEQCGIKNCPELYKKNDKVI